MPTLAEVRSKYPQYADMPDKQLADALHGKFYADMPRAEFDKRIGLRSEGEQRAYDYQRSTQPKGGRGFTDDVGDKFTLGLGNKFGSALSAIAGEAGERMGVSQPATFGERYRGALAAEQDALDEYRARNPVRSGVASALGIFSAAPASTALRPVAAAMRAGGVVGAAAGAGGAEPGDELSGAATGAAAGAALGGVIAKAAPVVARGASRLADIVRATPQGRAVAQAAQRRAVEVMPADVGGAAIKRTTAGVAQTLGAGPIREGSERTAQTFKAALDRTAPGAVDRAGAGQAAQRGVRAGIAAREATGSELYQSIPIAAESPAVLASTRQRLGDLTAGLQSNPQLSKLFDNPKLAAMKDALDGGNLTWADMLSFRSKIGELSGTARFSDPDNVKAYQALYGALSKDMESTARAQGPKAFQSWKRANTYWRGLEARKESALGAVIGKTSDIGEQQSLSAIERLASAKSGDWKKFGAVLRTMPAEEAATVRATVIDQLGHAKPGAQNAQGDAFSVGGFLTDWNALDGRAKTFLMPSSGGRAALDDLAVIAEGVKDSARFANTSGTAGAGNIIALLGAGAVGGLPAATTAASVQYLSGKMLASPTFARWLARTAKAPTVTRSHIGELSAIAARNPLIQGEIKALQSRLADAFAQTPLKAAAEGQEDQTR